MTLLNILEVTEDKIFETLGKGKDPNYKPINKASAEKKLNLLIINPCWNDNQG